MTSNEKPTIFTGESPAKLLSGVKTQTRRVMKPQPVSDPTFLGGLAFKTRKSSTSILSLQHGCYPDLCPYGKPGDLLWVKEGIDGLCGCDSTYLSDGERLVDSHPDKWNIWREGVDHRLPCKTIPAMFMPRWASRITLEITEVRVQRVQDISEQDAMAEGIHRQRLPDLAGNCFHWGDATKDRHQTAIDAFHALWDSLHAKPKPVLESGKTVSYISYPWAGTSETKTYRGKPWLVLPNPFVWAIAFKRVQTESREPK